MKRLWGSAAALAMALVCVVPSFGQEPVPQADPATLSAARVSAMAEVTSRSLVHVIRSQEAPSDRTTDSRPFAGTGISLGDGKFLTSAGVVGSAREVLIASDLGDTLVASVRGVDRRSNLAVVEAPGFGLPPLEVDSRALLFPGEWVVAVGFGSPATPRATFGTVVVSRGPTLGYGEIEMIQTTCPLFRGYTGGALLSAEGKLLGILSGVVDLDVESLVLPADTDLMAGILYDRLMTISPGSITVAMPATQALLFAEELATRGFVERGYLGLQVQLSEQQTLTAGSRGVLVHQIVEGGPAARAGILPGDFITEFDGAQVASREDLSFAVASRVPGSMVLMQFLRRGDRRFASITIDQAPPLAWEPSLDAGLLGRPGAVARQRAR